MDSIKAKLSASFKMRDLGEAKYILGIEIKRNCKLQTISLSQSQYSHTVLEHTDMSTCKPVWTPMAHNSQLSATDPEDDRIIPEQVIEGRQVSYLTIIGSLMYLMLRTHPNIAYVVGTLSHLSAKSKLAHWEAAKYVLRYIQARTWSLGLMGQSSPWIWTSMDIPMPDGPRIPITPGPLLVSYL